MRIMNMGIKVDQIFHTNEGEAIELDGDGVTLYLADAEQNGCLVAFCYSAEAFRQLLSAMNAADQELIKLEQRAGGNCDA